MFNFFERGLYKLPYIFISVSIGTYSDNYYNINKTK